MRWLASAIRKSKLSCLFCCASISLARASASTSSLFCLSTKSFSTCASLACIRALAAAFSASCSSLRILAFIWPLVANPTLVPNSSSNLSFASCCSCLILATVSGPYFLSRSAIRSASLSFARSAARSAWNASIDAASASSSSLLLLSTLAFISASRFFDLSSNPASDCPLSVLGSNNSFCIWACLLACAALYSAEVIPNCFCSVKLISRSSAPLPDSKLLNLFLFLAADVFLRLAISASWRICS